MVHLLRHHIDICVWKITSLDFFGGAGEGFHTYIHTYSGDKTLIGLGSNEVNRWTTRLEEVCVALTQITVVLSSFTHIHEKGKKKKGL